MPLLKNDFPTHHGTSKIIHRSRIDPDKVEILLQHPYFTEKTFTNQTTFIYDGEVKSVFDETVMALLKDENIDTSERIVEYWFQEQTTSQDLKPHCDFNHLARNGPTKLMEWAITDSKELFMSPFTMAVYLTVSDDMEGGELCISSISWEDDGIFAKTLDDLSPYPFEKFTPSVNDIVYFNGSSYFHWIAPVIQGTRRSMLINFWPKMLLDQFR